MASPELQRLWKLAQVDHAIESLKRRAAALDVGQKLAAELAALEKGAEEKMDAARKLRAELTDLELTQKGIDEKLKKIDKELYGGKLVSPREVETLEKEIVALKKQRSSHDERILGLWELLPPAEKEAEAAAAKVAEKQKELAERRKKARAEKEAIEAEYKRLAGVRPDLAKAVANPTLMARYDQIRQRHGGRGMAEVTKKQSCSACGTNLPERTIQALKDDKVMTCESCHRILYYTEGLV